MKDVRSEYFWRVSAAIFVIAAVYHAYQALVPDQLAGSLWFHSSFILIDLFFAVCLLVRPRWLPLIFACLTCHQIWTHGGRAFTLLSEGIFDHVSFLVIIMMPTWLAALYIEQRTALQQKEVGVSFTPFRRDS
ncbi:MAG: hypothetical protein GY947_12420 [Rhodobacteraceae bacterium]|nr:hypothetical protein [Paracoccaceae bacterium]